MRAIIRDTKRRLYCGPVALCAVTGLPASRILAVIEDERGGEAFRLDGARRGVRGVGLAEMDRVLRRLDIVTRYECVAPVASGLPTLAAWLKGRPRGRLIVHVRHHYVAIDGRTFIDTKTKGLPVPLSEAPGRRSRVYGFWRIGT